MNLSSPNSQTRFRFIADTVDDAISVRDINGARIYCNNAYIKLFGDMPDKIDNDPFGHICMEDRERVRQVFNRVIEKGCTESITYQSVLSDGKMHRLQSQGAPILNETTQVIEVVIVTRDLTQQEQEAYAQRRFNQELQQRVNEMSLINKMASQLYRCDTVEDVRKVLIKFANNLFSGRSGAIYIFDSKTDQFSEFLSWGKPRQCEKTFLKNQCRAVSEDDGSYVVADPESSTTLFCSHVDDAKFPYICIHRRGRGDIDLILHVEIPTTFDELNNNENKHRLISAQTEISVATARHAALAIENLSQKYELRKAAEVDELTGLFNRHYLVSTLKREILRAARNNSVLGVIMGDIDFFKKINDSYTHSGGDYVLKEVSRFLRSNIRQTDIACRYGGEEFMLIMPDSSYEGLIARGETLRQGVKDLSLEHFGKPIHVTVSLGIAMMAGCDAIKSENFIQLGDSAQFVAEEKAEELTQAADKALYQAKNDGRDRVVMWKNSFSSSINSVNI